jgi:hypothetical protein
MWFGFFVEFTVIRTFMARGRFVAQRASKLLLLFDARVRQSTNAGDALFLKAS